MSSPAGQWVPLLEYAVRKGVSLSTLRRYIKAEKIIFKNENGRYLIWDSSDSTDCIDRAPRSSADADVSGLQDSLKRAQEEIAELKMLIALYEEKLPGAPLDI
jgi:hypothetical protein